MIEEILAVGLIISAFLAIYLEEAVYSISSLAITLMLMAILYSVNDANFAAIFLFVISTGTLTVLFLSGETLIEKIEVEKKLRKVSIGLVIGFFLSIPTLFISLVANSVNILPEASFSEALLGLRGIDIVIQGLVILTISIGVTIILFEKGRNNGD